MKCLLQIQRKPLLPTANSFPGQLQIHGNTVHDAPRVKVFNLTLCESLLCCHPLSDNYCAMHRQYFNAICATVFINMCHSDLIKHSLCKTFSNRPGPNLESYVSSALPLPEDLLHLVQGLHSQYLYQRGKKRVYFDQCRNSSVCLAVAPPGANVPRYLQDGI